MHETAGDMIKPVLVNSTVAIQLFWDVPRPDDRVEVDIWTSSFDVQSIVFKQNFEHVAEVFGTDLEFQAHYVILDGFYWGCTRPGLPCQNRCLSGGRYCAIDPDGDPTESVLVVCVIVLCLFRDLLLLNQCTYVQWRIRSRHRDRESASVLLVELPEPNQSRCEMVALRQPFPTKLRGHLRILQHIVLTAPTQSHWPEPHNHRPVCHELWRLHLVANHSKPNQHTHEQTDFRHECYGCVLHPDSVHQSGLIVVCCCCYRLRVQRAYRGSITCPEDPLRVSTCGVLRQVCLVLALIVCILVTCFE